MHTGSVSSAPSRPLFRGAAKFVRPRNGRDGRLKLAHDGKSPAKAGAAPAFSGSNWRELVEIGRGEFRSEMTIPVLNHIVIEFSAGWHRADACAPKIESTETLMLADRIVRIVVFRTRAAQRTEMSATDGDIGEVALKPPPSLPHLRRGRDKNERTKMSARLSSDKSSLCGGTSRSPTRPLSMPRPAFHALSPRPRTELSAGGVSPWPYRRPAP